jgi:RNA polymerase sigma-70 factor (ECF subfamily)
MASIDSEAQDRFDMQRLAAGQNHALNDLMARHAVPLVQFLFRLLDNEADAEDLAQETFARVYRHRTRYNPARKFTTWLYSIAANLARNELRRRTRHNAFSLHDNGTGQELAGLAVAKEIDPGSAAETRERFLAVVAAVRSLPEDLREVVVLCEWEGFSAADAAEVLASSNRAIESRLYRARKLLRALLSNWLRN